MTLRYHALYMDVFIWIEVILWTVVLPFMLIVLCGVRSVLRGKKYPGIEATKTHATASVLTREHLKQSVDDDVTDQESATDDDIIDDVNEIDDDDDVFVDIKSLNPPDLLRGLSRDSSPEKPQWRNLSISRKPSSHTDKNLQSSLTPSPTSHYPPSHSPTSHYPPGFEAGTSSGIARIFLKTGTANHGAVPLTRKGSLRRRRSMRRRRVPTIIVTSQVAEMLKEHDAVCAMTTVDAELLKNKHKL